MAEVAIVHNVSAMHGYSATRILLQSKIRVQIQTESGSDDPRITELFYTASEKQHFYKRFIASDLLKKRPLSKSKTRQGAAVLRSEMFCLSISFARGFSTRGGIPEVYAVLS